jgi:hypothetical protein
MLPEMLEAAMAPRNLRRETFFLTQFLLFSSGSLQR